MSNLIIGQPLSRIDGRQKVTGAARYAAEFDLPRRVYAVAIQSTIARGSITDIETRDAEMLPGVLTIMTYKNAPKLHPFPDPSAKGKPEDTQRSGKNGKSGSEKGENKQAGSQQKTPGRPGQKLLPLQDDQIYYSGQHIGLAVAQTLEQAMHAASLVRFQYKTEPPITAINMDHAFSAPDEPGREPYHYHRGEPDMMLSMAPVRIEQTYITPVENHNPMEPSATTAAWDGDHLTLYDATQGVSGSEYVAATLLGIPPENVRVISPFLGGGFGCKGFSWPHTVLAALAARAVGRPVTLALSRRQMFTSVGYRAQTIQRLSLGATHDGNLVSMIHTTTNLTSPYDEFTEKAGVMTPMLYACPNVRISHKLARVNKGTPTPMRAPGEAPGSFALESAMDELAYALKMDPIELRLRNYALEDPSKNLPWSSKSLRECYNLGAEKFGWSRRTAQPRSMHDGDYLIGMGMVSSTYPTNSSPASARVQIFADGRARALSGTQDLGTGTYTTMTQITAEILGLDVRNVHFELGDTTFPTAPVSGGSQTSASVGSAVKAAALNARQKMIQLAVGDVASPLYNRPTDHIMASNGRLYLDSEPNRSESFRDILKRHNLDSLEAEGNWKPGEESKQYSMHAFGAQFAEVRVNAASGETQVSRMVGVFGAGQILNARTARSQFMGGMIFGIGMALMEDTIMDARTGRIINADLAEYLVPVNRDAPRIEVYTIEEQDSRINLIGSKGIGEIGIVGSGAAIANAVYHATGKRIRELPITPDKLV